MRSVFGPQVPSNGSCFVCDLAAVSDPAPITNHIGKSPAILDRVAHAPALVNALAGLRTWVAKSTRPSSMYILFICTAARHRSVAACELTTAILDAECNFEIVHAGRDDSWASMRSCFGRWESTNPPAAVAKVMKDMRRSIAYTHVSWDEPTLRGSGWYGPWRRAVPSQEVVDLEQETPRPSQRHPGAYSGTDRVREAPTGSGASGRDLSSQEAALQAENARLRVELLAAENDRLRSELQSLQGGRDPIPRRGEPTELRSDADVRGRAAARTEARTRETLQRSRTPRILPAEPSVPPPLWKRIPRTSGAIADDWRHDITHEVGPWLDRGILAELLDTLGSRISSKFLRCKQELWCGPSDELQTAENFRQNIRVVLYDVRKGMDMKQLPRFVAVPREMHPLSWSEVAFTKRGRTWTSREGDAGSTEIDSGADFVLVVQHPTYHSSLAYEKEKQAYTAIMNPTQRNSYRSGVRTVCMMDRCTAMVAGIPSYSPDSDPATTLILIHDNQEFPLCPGISQMSPKDYKITRLVHEINEHRPGLIVYKALEPDSKIIMDLLCESDASGVTVCVLSPMSMMPYCGVYTHECEGDADMVCVGPLARTIGKDICVWFEGDGYTPKAYQDTNQHKFVDLLKTIADEAYLEMMSSAMVAATGGDLDDVPDYEPDTPEGSDVEIAGGVGDLEGVSSGGVEEAQVREEQERLVEQAMKPPMTPEERERAWLESLPLPGVPKNEQERRALWRKLPQKVRVAIRRLHRQFNHPAPRTLEAILKAGGASKEFVQAAKLVRCDTCIKTSGKPRGHPVGSGTKEYQVGDALGVDILEVVDSDKQRFQCMNMVDIASGFQQLEVLRPVSKEPPKVLMADRGTHNRELLSKWAAEKGIDLKYAPTEAPWQLGKVERHGGLAKAIVRKVIHETPVRGITEVRRAAQEVVAIKNAMVNSGGYSPQQWITGRNPTEPGALTHEDGWADLGALEARHSKDSEFAQRHQMRMNAKRAMIHLDCSRRVRKALTRNAVAIREDYLPGDFVVYRRDMQTGGTKWSSVARVIGKENSESVWVVHAGIPILCSAHSLRPASEEEVMSHCMLKGTPILPESLTEGPRGKQGFIDAREPLEVSEQQQNSPEAGSSEDPRKPKPSRQPPDSPEAGSTQDPKKRKIVVKQAEDAPIGASSSSSSSSSSDSEDDAKIAIDKTGEDNEAFAVEEIAMSQAEQMAKEALDRGDFRPGTCLEILRATKMKQRKGEREATKSGRSYSLGAYAHGPFAGLTNATMEQVWFVRYVNEYLKAKGATEGWSSFVVNFNTEASLHKDSNNLPGSMNQLTSLGPFTGGELWVRDSSARGKHAEYEGRAGRLLESRHKIVAFGPDQPHATMPFEGERWSISTYASRGYASLDKEQRKALKSLGFHTEPLEALMKDTGYLSYRNGVEIEENSDVAEEMSPSSWEQAINEATSHDGSEDYWQVMKGHFIRVHKKPREMLYTPDESDFPGSIDEISYSRSTYKTFADGTEQTVEDEWGMIREADSKDSREWTGFTCFKQKLFGSADLSSLPDAPVSDAGYIAFMTERFAKTAIAEEAAQGKKPKKLDIRDVDERTRDGILGARGDEWKKYQTWNAAVPIQGELLGKLLQEGHKPVPSQWVDVDKHEHLKGTEAYTPKFRSRLVSCGNFEDVDKSQLRCDSPTAEAETHCMIASYAACHRLRLYCGDVSSAYFQSEPLERVILMKQPRGGLPGVDPEAMLLCRLPVYGTMDAGRGFFVRLSKAARQEGLKMSKIGPGLYYVPGTDGIPAVMLGTHVDDLLWAHTDEGKKLMDRVLSHFELGKIEEGEFRYCGRRFRQDSEYNVSIDTEDNG